MKFWDTTDEPLRRWRAYMESKGYWTPDDDKQWMAEARKRVLEAFAAGEKRKRLPITTMFDDVYKEQPPRLRQQLEDMKRHVERHASSFSTLDMHEK